MKVTYKSDGKTVTQTVHDYVREKLTPSAWEHDTYERRLEATNENVLDAFLRLLQIMIDDDKLTDSKLAYVVGDNGKVEIAANDSEELKVGDKVVVDLSGWYIGDKCKHTGYALVDDMVSYDGESAIVTYSTEYGAYIIDIDDGDYTWSSMWLRKM